MKIERPKSENFLLSVAAQPASQRAVVEAIVRCTTPAELDKLLSGLRFWSWDRVSLAYTELALSTVMAVVCLRGTYSVGRPCLICLMTT